MSRLPQAVGTLRYTAHLPRPNTADEPPYAAFMTAGSMANHVRETVDPN